MEGKEKSTFNPKQVRQSFKSRFCKELPLPSGKPSGYYLYPITEEEINERTQDIQTEEKPKQFLTWSEWAMFTALRRKYGINYMNPPTKQERYLARPDPLCEEPKEENIEEKLERKLINYCDFRLDDMFSILLEKSSTPEPAQVTDDLEKNKKNFRSSLDNEDFDVLY